MAYQLIDHRYKANVSRTVRTRFEHPSGILLARKMSLSNTMTEFQDLLDLSPELDVQNARK